MVTRLDKEIGRLLKTLDELGLAKNTLVVFSSDHGATFEVGNHGASAFHDSNAPFRGHKRTLWEGGIRVPGVVRWPGQVPSGQVSEEIIHMTDVFPSFLAAAGGAAENVDGKNMIDIWRGKSKAPERTLFWEWRTEGSFQLAAMRGNLKLVIPNREVFERASTNINGIELYDVATDPAERRTLAAGRPNDVRQLRNQLLDWLNTEAYLDASFNRQPSSPPTRRRARQP